MVTPESQKVSKFERGLHAEIQHAITGVRAKNFPIVVRRAHAVERNLQEAKMEWATTTVKITENNGRKRGRDTSFNQGPRIVPE